MRVVATSDTHGRKGWSVDSCDVLIHAGDMTAGGTLLETVKFLQTLKKMDSFGHLILVPGNHDRCCQWEREEVRDVLADTFGERAHLLIDEGVTIDGVTFWGSPWTLPFMEWSFMAAERHLRQLYEAIPKRLDVLVTHGPPFGILDPGWKVEHAGSVCLLDAVMNRSVRHHIFGHLHAAGGTGQKTGQTHFHNVAACDEAYRLTRPPLVLNIKPDQEAQK